MARSWLLHFLALAREHAEAGGDWDCVEALALFIAEEQRHSGMLARYLRAVGVDIRQKDGMGRVFRKLRQLAGLECMVTVLVTAEIMAVPYYRSVQRVSACPALRAICRRILGEKAQHLRFQQMTLEPCTPGGACGGLRSRSWRMSAFCWGSARWCGGRTAPSCGVRE